MKEYLAEVFFSYVEEVQKSSGLADDHPALASYIATSRAK
jgi:hypothetical protein